MTEGYDEQAGGGDGPVPPTQSRLLVKRGGRSVTRMVPKPVLLVDTREQRPFTFERFGNWVGGVRRATLATGDYSIEGLEHAVAIERKSLTDLLSTLMHSRPRFIAECERLAQFRHRGLLVEATYEDLKTRYTESAEYSQAHPNGIVGSLDALEARFGIPVHYTSRNRDLAEEKLASLLTKLFTYDWLERNGHGRVLQEDDF